MKILFIHPNMPGQYKHLARIYGADPKNQVVFLTKPKQGVEIPGVKKVEYEASREPVPEQHSYTINFSRAIVRGQEVWRMCKKLKEKGFIPDVIVGHLGWGEGMFLKLSYPEVPILSFFEFFYSPFDSDSSFLKEHEEVTPDQQARVMMKNALHFYNFHYSDWGITPTYFQQRRLPKEYYYKTSVLHDGIDTDVARPGAGRTLTLPDGITLSPRDEIVTYISRNFEPYRGFTQFMQAAEIILKRRPHCHIIMVGGDEVSYGAKPKGNKTYRQEMLEKVSLDMKRFHQLPRVPYEMMIKIMQISGAHIYLTVPFVLSWSSMEAMACGCLMICSNTEPVLEVMQDRKNALIVDFFSPKEIADRVDEVFTHPDRLQQLRRAARQTILDKYALTKVLPLHQELIQDLASRKMPPPTAAKIMAFNPEIY